MTKPIFILLNLLLAVVAVAGLWIAIVYTATALAVSFGITLGRLCTADAVPVLALSSLIAAVSTFVLWLAYREHRALRAAARAAEWYPEHDRRWNEWKETQR